MKESSIDEMLNRVQQDGFSLSTHLKSLLRHIQTIDTKSKENGVVNLEKISKILKNSQFEFVKSKTEPPVLPKGTYIPSPVLTNCPRVRCSNLTGSYIDDFEAKMEALEAVGKGFAKLDCVKIGNSIVKIANDPTFDEVQFFGKIICTKQDYYVIWARHAKINPEGDSLDSVSFFVSSDLNSWTKLRQIRAKTVRESRQIKAMFSGELGAKVTPNLTEEDYLHANLVRILFSNFAVPNGLLAMNAETENLTERVPDFKLAAESCAEAAGWVHRFPSIMLYGDTWNRWANEPEIVQKMETTDPLGKRLAPLSEDGRAWQVTIVKNKHTFVGREDTAESRKVQVVALTNDVWPGAINFFSEFSGQFGFFYCGYGIKSTKSQTLISSKILKINEDIMKVGLRDYKEPNPDEGQEVLETDSEPEKNSSDEKDENE